MRQRGIETKGTQMADAQMERLQKYMRQALIASALLGGVMMAIGFYIGHETATAKIRVELLPCG